MQSQSVRASPRVGEGMGNSGLSQRRQNIGGIVAEQYISEQSLLKNCSAFKPDE